MTRAGERGIKRVQDDLRLFQNAVAGITEAVVITDGNWDQAQPTILFANPAFCEMTGFSCEEVTGRTLALVHGVKTERIPLARLEQDLQTYGKAVYQTVMYRKNGQEHSVEWEVKPLRNGANVITNYLIFHRDVTERNLLREQLQQAQKMEAVGRLASGIAHDFNNLLTVILGYAGFLALEIAPEAPPESKQLRSLIEIQKASEKAAALTSQLLAFSRKQTLRTRVLDLNPVVANMEGMLRRLVGEDVELELALGENLGTVRADAGQVAQVLINLAANARDAMPKGGMLTIQTRNTEISSRYAPATSLSAGRYVSLAVTDTGVGMDDATRARVFEPFFTTKEPGRGTGLGLSTVQAFVQQMGGAIEVTSAPGMGSCFNLSIPRVDALPELPETRAASASARGSGVILVVDDDAGIRELLQEVLEDAGYQVLTAADAQQAIASAVLHTGVIDLLLTDIVLPGASGLDLAAQLRAARPRLRVLFVSGYSDHALLRHGNLEREAAFLPKPFATETLLATVHALVSDQCSAGAN